MSAWGRRLVVLVGLSAVSLSVVVASAPATLGPIVHPDSLERTVAESTPYLVVVLAILATVVALIRGLSASVTRPRPLAADRSPDSERARPTPRSTGSPEPSPAGDSFDADLTTAVDGPTLHRSRARYRLEQRLSTVATERIAVVEGCDADAARRRIAAGIWTEDVLAAAFLGDERAPDLPLRWRLYAWLYEARAYERSVDRTVVAIERYGRDDSSSESSTEPTSGSAGTRTTETSRSVPDEKPAAEEGGVLR